MVYPWISDPDGVGGEPGMQALVVLLWRVRAPFRVLVRAQDLYVSLLAAAAAGGEI